ncbi:MAG: hypothetical protein HRU41_26445 [Saprospiraceae bacterium]|nr:hypothetical protein [Saprospiraceae bacterium]
MSRKELSLFLFLCLSALAIHAQQTQVIEKYMSKFEEGFEFDPGLYTSLDDWKNNEPSIPIYWIIGYEPEGSDPKTFLSQEMKKKSIDCIDPEGRTFKIKPKKLWGYSDGENVYKDTYQLTKVGSICYFVEDNGKGGGVDMSAMTAKGDEAEYTPPPKGAKEYLFDFNTGKRMKYSAKSFEKIIAKDGILLTEFTKRDKREKEEIFPFIAKFNQRHPIHFKVEKPLEEEDEETLEEAKPEGVNN